MKNRNSRKFNILKNSGGFSIAELILALVLLLIVLGLGYNLLFFARSSFERSEERWMEQNEVVAISNIIYDSLNEAYYVEILPAPSPMPTGLDFYGAFYVDASGKTIYEHFDGNDEIKTEIPGENLTIEFAKVTYTINEIPYEYNDLLNVTVISNILEYTISTQIHLDNMNRDRTIQGLASGSTVVFKTKEVVETVPETLYDTLCFVATAAYESPMNPSVMLLRRFRDDYLLETGMGTEFVEFYYKNSPPVASVIAESSMLRFLTRAVLYPVVGFVSLVMNPLHLLSVLAGILLALMIYNKKFGFERKRKYLR